MANTKSQNLDYNFLKLIFNAVAIANLADNAATAPLTNLYVSLHTADPMLTESTGLQNTSETTYTGYARVAVARTSGGWTVTNAYPASVSPAANIDFGQCTAGTATITNFAVGVAASGATAVLYSGTVTPNISVTSGVIPRLTTASAITES